MAIDIEIPENMPRMGNKFTWAFGRLVMRLLGWRITGKIPNEKKLMLVAAPHISNWDFIVGMAAMMAIGLEVSFFIKQEAFFWPFEGLLMALGGIPIQRGKSATGLIAQTVKTIETTDNIWVAITPEGTRKKVERWKPGFVHIAHRAQVPIAVMVLDGTNKEIVFDKVVEPTDQFIQQAEELRDYIRTNFDGIKPENH